MKLSKIVVVILLIILCACGWASCVLGIGNPEPQMNEDGTVNDREQCVTLGADYFERGLYQKAAIQYRTAAVLENLEGDWASMMQAYAAWYAEDEGAMNTYLDDSKKAVKAYPQRIDFCKTAVELAILNKDYDTAFSMLSTTINTGVTDSEIESLFIQVRYAIDMGNSVYYDYLSCGNGYFCVCSADNQWGIIDEKGNTRYAMSLDKVFPVGEDGVFTCVERGNGAVRDIGEILQGKLSFIPEDAGVYSAGMIPIRKDGLWGYYNELGDYCFGSYIEAGKFQDGKAAVRTEKGWTLVDQSGIIVSEVYEEISLTKDGSWECDGIMLVKANGNWMLLNSKETALEAATVSSEECGFHSDQMVAFRNGEKWGFFDKSGAIIIEPTYEAAHSFSNGLAAVRISGKWGFIDDQGELVIPAQYLSVDDFTEAGTCIVELSEGSYQLIRRHVNK